ncbi:MAG TPA: hypothetical protein VGZ93_03875 [Candidatus Methylacidiphilales bacterium]|jgi:hypothetical protein|nr:hypothetical protein [Candidatus Methylacidiphilales bacterium]
MSLLHSVHKSVVIKFSDAAREQFNPDVSYVFRLTGVDAMGFLQVQDLKPGAHGGHEAVSEPYWINKDLIREIHDFDSVKVKKSLHYTGQPAKPAKKASVKPA